ncbi:MAG: biotin-dependent carboxyltransferase family protein [Mycobacteriales bacterium]
MIRVRRAGLLTTVQDLGRAGHAHLGVPHAGAVDAPSLRLANRLVGNDERAAGLEITLAGPELVLDSPTFVALTGGSVEAMVDGRPVPMHVAQCIPSVGALVIGPVTTGVRTYLGVRGGIDVPPVLGSRSTDTLSGLGPPKLADGQSLPVGSMVAGEPWEEVVPTPAIEVEPVLLVTPGPRDDHFEPGAVERLCHSAWAVTARGDRAGVWLEGPPLRWSEQRELRSEGVVTGAIQVPPDGQPIVFLANHPTIGGYPVIAVVVTADLPLAAQARPGTTLRFRAVSASG